MGRNVGTFRVLSTKIGLVEIGQGFQHNRKRCPCLKCFEWRRSMYTPKVLSEMQERIRKTIWENRRISRELEQYFDKT